MQQPAPDVSRSDRARSLDAMHILEAMIGRAAPGRDSDWQSDVVDALRHIEAALQQQQASYEDPTSLLAEIAQEQPRLRTWVRQLHRQWAELAASAQTLRQQLEQPDDAPWNYADLRERLNALLKALHHHRVREADLVFEALSIDLGVGD
jgi:DNA repair ATPase RecN